MTTETRVTLAKGGTAERVEKISALSVADLWHAGEFLDAEAGREVDAAPGYAAQLRQHAENVREVWHLAHDLKRHIEEQPAPLTAPQGSQLLGFIENSKGDQFIMAKTDGAQPFATWQRSADDGGCFWGHYFMDERAALADLIERASA